MVYGPIWSECCFFMSFYYIFQSKANILAPNDPFFPNGITSCFLTQVILNVATSYTWQAEPFFVACLIMALLRDPAEEVLLICLSYKPEVENRPIF